MAVDAWRDAPVNRRSLEEPSPPSPTWYRGFTDRHPELNRYWATPIQKERHVNATRANIGNWFSETILPLNALYRYNKYMVANCDETMVQANGKKRMRIVAPARSAYKKFVDQAPLQHITFVSTIFASGAHAQTLIIYPTKTIPSEISLDEVAGDEDFVITGNPGGWIDKQTFALYCRQIIIPRFEEQRIACRDPTARGLFIVDGHSSRWNPELMDLFAERQIDVVTLVSHTSHVCQPLDALVFGVFKQNLQRSLRRAIRDVQKSPPTDEELEALGTADTDLNTAPNDMDTDSDEYGDFEEARSVSEDEGTNDVAATHGDQQFSTPLRRYILVKVAKLALHGALYRDNVIQSFKMTGMFPMCLETLLNRKGVVNELEVAPLSRNTSGVAKKTRTSINGLILTSEESRNMLRDEAKKTAAVARRKAPKRTGASRKKTN